jgi:predicted permease
VISYGLWQQRFGGDPGAIGKPVFIDDVPFTITGVTPPSFFGVDVGRNADVILPLETEPLVHVHSPMIGSPEGPMWLRIMLRLKPGQSFDAATATMRALQPTLRELGMPPALERFPESKRKFLQSPFVVASAATGTSYLRDEYTRPLLALFVIVALVLLIACANIGNLQLARATARRHDMSVRRALGASRWRLARQLLVESLVIAAIGAAGGVLIAFWGSRALVTQLTSIVEHVQLDLSLDWRVLGFTIVVTALTALIFGTAPAWRTSRVEPIDALKEQGRQTSGGGASISGSLVIAQVALSLVLLVAAGLFIGTFARLATRALGFDADRLLVFFISAGASDIAPDDRAAFYQRLADRASTVPGVEHAAASSMAPFGMSAPINFKMPGDTGSGTGTAATTLPRAALFVIAPTWLDTYGLTLRAGRDFTTHDSAHAPFVMLVNDAFVRANVPSGQALDQLIGLSIVGKTLGSRTIVGIVSDTVGSSVRDDKKPAIYLPMAQWDLPIPLMTRFYVTARASGGIDPATLTQSVTAALKAVDPKLGLSAHTLDSDVRRSFAQERLIAMLSGAFGILALVLATIGLYGVTAYTVTRRHLEIGIRLALGSTPGGVVRLVLARVAVLIGLGVLVGVAASVWIGQFAAPLLFGVTPRDPGTMAMAAAILALIGAVAGGLPAWRASRLDPTRVLRSQ